MTDYKNTPEGKITSQKYADLLPLSRPAPIKPRMAISNRAKIFSPFAALRGYEDEIASGKELPTIIPFEDILEVTTK